LSKSFQNKNTSLNIIIYITTQPHLLPPYTKPVVESSTAHTIHVIIAKGNWWVRIFALIQCLILDI